MKNKRLFLLGLTFVFLVIVAFLLMEMPGEKSESPEEGDRLVDLDSAVIANVEIVAPSYQVTLVKRGAQWDLQAPIVDRADQSSVASLIGALASLRSRSVVSTNPEKRNLFNVDSTGTVVTLSGADTPPVALVIGKMGATYTETYIRPVESDDVHLVSASLAFIESRGLNGWRDKSIVKVPREEIRRVTYHYGDTTFSLEFRDSLWTLDGARGDDALVNTLLASLADVQADGFLEPPPSPVPPATATVKYAGKELRFSPGPSADVYHVQRTADERWFEMRAWRAQQVLKRKSELLAKERE